MNSNNPLKTSRCNVPMTNEISDSNLVFEDDYLLFQAGRLQLLPADTMEPALDSVV